MAFDFDLFVIGAGSGGVRAARMAAAHGGRVAVAEERDLGGTCVNAGCVPKKLFTYAAHYAEDFEDSRAYGWAAERPAFDWPTLRAAKDREIARLNGVYGQLLESAGVTLFRGRARLDGAHAVRVGAATVTAASILVATGGWPAVPAIPGREHVFTSNEAFHLERLPRRLVIVGGGYIAVEFAGIFSGLGVEVIQLYRGPLFLRGFDDDVRRTLAGEMRKKGVDLRFGADVARISREGGELAVHAGAGDPVRCDAVMYATGRSPNTAGLGLEEAGVALDPRGAVIVDDRFRSSVPHILALGDVIDRVALTPVAIAEGMVVASNLFCGTDLAMDYDGIPSAVFSNPAIGAVGLTEAGARARHDAVDVYVSSFRPMRHALTGRDERTFMKLVVETGSDRVVGFHMVGADAGETTQGVAVALKAGATKARFDATIGIHPTAAEEFVTMRAPAPDPAAAGAG